MITARGPPPPLPGYLSSECPGLHFIAYHISTCLFFCLLRLAKDTLASLQSNTYSIHYTLSHTIHILLIKYCVQPIPPLPEHLYFECQELHFIAHHTYSCNFTCAWPAPPLPGYLYFGCPKLHLRIDTGGLGVIHGTCM